MGFAFNFAKMMLGLLVATSLAVAGCKANLNQVEERPDMTFIKAEDTEINAAMAHARETFSEFWDAKAKNDPKFSDFNVKIGLPDSTGSTEHIWVNDLKRDADNYSGTLINEPFRLPQYKIGDEVNFTDEQVSDWQFMKNGISEGNFTTRVILKTMSDEKAAEIRTMLGWDK